MKRTWAFIAGIGLSLITTRAQPENTADAGNKDDAFSERRDTIPALKDLLYIEGWGISSVLGVHYERTLVGSRVSGLAARAGVGTIHLRDFTGHLRPDVVIPIGAYFFIGRKAQGEVGAGCTVTSIVYPDPETFTPEREQRIHGWCSLGIRSGEIAGRGFIRGAANLLFQFGRVDSNFGLAVGYRF